jgi:hypothetical protein
MNPVHTHHLISVSYILILFLHLRPGSHSGLFLSGFPTKILYAFFLSSMLATYSAHVIVLEYIIVITIFGEGYKLRSRNVLLNTSSVYLLSLMSKTKFHTYTNAQTKFIYVFWRQTSRRKSSQLNGGKHYHKSICSWFPSESNFDLLLSSSYVWAMFLEVATYMTKYMRESSWRKIYQNIFIFS